MELTTLTIIVQLIFLEGILSIDNAAVLGAMVNHLPNDKPIPWPRRLAHLHAWGDRVLGNQRDAALKVGLQAGPKTGAVFGVAETRFGQLGRHIGLVHDVVQSGL